MFISLGIYIVLMTCSFSILPALSLDGILHVKVVDGSFNTESFLEFIDDLTSKSDFGGVGAPEDWRPSTVVGTGSSIDRRPSARFDWGFSAHMGCSFNGIPLVAVVGLVEDQVMGQGAAWDPF